MARPLRIESPGALYHEISRGNERCPVVRDDEDRAKRLDWLRRAVETYGWRLHAFAVLRNHEDLFVETPEANLSAGKQMLNGSYTDYFNRGRHRSGHLFQGRFLGHLVEEDGCFLEVRGCYIHLNPVRAKMVRRPEKYRWSGCPGYLRARHALEWVTYARVLGKFGAGSLWVQRHGGRRAPGAPRPERRQSRRASGGPGETAGDRGHAGGETHLMLVHYSSSDPNRALFKL